MRPIPPAVVALLIVGCATRADESGVHIDLRAEGQHPGYVALQLYVADKPLHPDAQQDPSAPNACYEVTNEQGKTSSGLARLEYDGQRVAGLLLGWGDVTYTVDVAIQEGAVDGKASFAVGRMVNSSRVSGHAKPLHNLDRCRRLARD